MGYMREMPIERLVRDVRITTIYEGTSQIHIGACYKSVVNDVLATYFEEQERKNYQEDLLPLANKMTQIRQMFGEMLVLVNGYEDTKIKEAAGKEIVDVYSRLYQGYLLLEEAKASQRKLLIAKRFVNQSLAKTHSSLQAIRNNQFEDIADAGTICN